MLRTLSTQEKSIALPHCPRPLGEILPVRNQNRPEHSQAWCEASALLDDFGEEGQQLPVSHQDLLSGSGFSPLSPCVTWVPGQEQQPWAEQVHHASQETSAGAGWES